jgi:hypothetical protein
VERIAVSISEAVRLTCLSRTAIFGLIREGRLDAPKIGKRRFVTTASLRELFETE